MAVDDRDPSYNIVCPSSSVLYVVVPIPGLGSGGTAFEVEHKGPRRAYGELRQKRYLQPTKLQYQG